MATSRLWAKLQSSVIFHEFRVLIVSVTACIYSRERSHRTFVPAQPNIKSQGPFDPSSKNMEFLLTFNLQFNTFVLHLFLVVSLQDFQPPRLTHLPPQEVCSHRVVEKRLKKTQTHISSLPNTNASRSFPLKNASLFQCQETGPKAAAPIAYHVDKIFSVKSASLRRCSCIAEVANRIHGEVKLGGDCQAFDVDNNELCKFEIETELRLLSLFVCLLSSRVRLAASQFESSLVSVPQVRRCNAIIHSMDYMPHHSLLPFNISLRLAVNCTTPRISAIICKTKLLGVIDKWRKCHVSRTWLHPAWDHQRHFDSGIQ